MHFIPGWFCCGEVCAVPVNHAIGTFFFVLLYVSQANMANTNASVSKGINLLRIYGM
jgi:hypothetical protein